MNIKDANATNTRKSNCRGQKIQKLEILENPNTEVKRYKNYKYKKIEIHWSKDTNIRITRKTKYRGQKIQTLEIHKKNQIHRSQAAGCRRQYD